MTSGDREPTASASPSDHLCFPKALARHLVSQRCILLGPARCPDGLAHRLRMMALYRIACDECVIPIAVQP